MKYKFVTNCVASTCEAITSMVDAARPIQYETFRRYVDIKELEETLGYAGSPLRIKDDYAVTFYRSKYRGRSCVYVNWSAIEYIFCKG
jgi:hypothetical protein